MGGGRIRELGVVEQPGDSANYRACNFDVEAPGWLHQRTSQWFDGVSSGSLDKDVGSAKLGAGLVIEGLVFGADDYRIALEASAGGATPARTTDFGYAGNGAYVFQPSMVGAYSFDLRVVRPPKTSVLYHVHFAVVP